jgi:hypothetical protein
MKGKAKKLIGANFGATFKSNISAENGLFHVHPAHCRKNKVEFLDQHIVNGWLDCLSQQGGWWFESQQL